MKPDERFKILQSIGRDTVGEIFQTVKLQGEGLAAVKVFEEWTVQDADARASYAKAIQNIHAVGPARTPRPLALQVEQDNAWIATEWVGAESLASFVKRQGAFDPDVAIGIACGILDALMELHQAGIPHGNLSLDNIHLSQGFLPGGVILSQPAQNLLWGSQSVLRRANAGDETKIPDVRFMAPEQIGGGPASVQSDLYAVGAILYLLLTGKPLFDGSTPEILRAHLSEPAPKASASVAKLPPDLEDILGLALGKDDTARFQATIAMRRALAHCRKSGDEASEKAAAPLGVQLGQDIQPLITAADTVVTPVSTKAVEPKKADDWGAAPKKSDGKKKGKKDKGGWGEDTAAQASEEAPTQKSEPIQAAAPVVEESANTAPRADVSFADPVAVEWFSQSNDKELMEKRYGDEEPPTVLEINRQFRKISYAIIGAVVLVGIGIFAALVFATGSSKKDAPADNESSAIEFMLPG